MRVSILTPTDALLCFLREVKHELSLKTSCKCLYTLKHEMCSAVTPRRPTHPRLRLSNVATLYLPSAVIVRTEEGKRRKGKNRLHLHSKLKKNFSYTIHTYAVKHTINYSHALPRSIWNDLGVKSAGTYKTKGKKDNCIPLSCPALRMV